MLGVPLVYHAPCLGITDDAVGLERTAHKPAHAVGLALGFVGIGRLQVIPVLGDAVGDVLVGIGIGLALVVYISRDLSLNPHKAVVTQVFVRTFAYLAHRRQTARMPPWTQRVGLDSTAAVDAVVVV